MRDRHTVGVGERNRTGQGQSTSEKDKNRTERGKLEEKEIYKIEVHGAGERLCG